MAFPSTLLLTLLFVTVTVPIAQSSIAGGVLGGTICSTNTSLATVGTYPVMDGCCLRRRFSRKSIKTTQTNLAGVYSFIFTLVDTILNDPNRCYLLVKIPPNSCTFSVPNGILRIPIGVLSTIDALVGSILMLVPS